MLAGYHIDQHVETGLKGELYRGHEQTSGARCLMRLLPSNSKNSGQFISEGQLACSFFHPNVADVYDAGQLDSGELFVVYEDSGAQTLRELLNTVGTPELLNSVQIVRQAAEAVHALHQGGLMHGAINPENITLTTDIDDELLVRVRGVDFGSVIERSIVSNKFQIDSAIDWIRYFAPEQCTNGPVSPQTDVYSLGIILYELIAGVPPFDASKAAGIIEKHKKQPPPEIKIENFELRMLLTHTLSESLQKQPKFRQSSANAFARQLRHMEQLATHTSTPAPAQAMPESEPKISAFVTAASSPAKMEVKPFVQAPARAVAMPDYIEEKAGSPSREDLPWNASSSTLGSPGVFVEDELEEPQATTAEPTDVLPAASLEVPRVESRPTVKLDAVDDVDYLSQLLSRSVESDKTGRGSRLARLRHKVKEFRTLITLSALGSRETAALSITETESAAPEEVSFEAVARTNGAPGPITRAPKKITWEQPDDDLPSEADVLAELLDKPKNTPVEAKGENLNSDVFIGEGLDHFVSRVPKKIDWPTPDDDIPSEAAVLEALMQEPVKKWVDESVIETASIEPLAAEPAIEEPVVEMLAASTEVDEISSEKYTEQALIEPTAAPIQVQVASESISEEVVVDHAIENIAEAAPEEIMELSGADVQNEEAAPIECVPDDLQPEPIEINPDVISVKVASEPIIVPEPPKPVDHSHVTNAAVERRYIGRLVSAEPARPVKTITRNVRDITHHRTVHTTEPAPSVQRVQIHSEPVRAPLPPADAEEITIVRARPIQNRIAMHQVRGELPPKRDETRIVRRKAHSGPRAQAAPERSKEFLPNQRLSIPRSREPKLIAQTTGNRIRVHTIDLVPSDGVLSSYAAPKEPRFSIDYRSLFIGGGLILLIAVLVLGNVFVKRFSQADTSSDTAISRTDQKTKRAGKTGPDVTIKQLQPKTVDKPVQEVDQDEGVRPSYKEREPLFPEKVRPTEIKSETKNKIPNSKTVSQNIANLPPISSTIVIYSENGRVRTRTEPDYPGTDRRSSPGPTKAPVNTRPRVVKNPKP